jgi:hypothetical protein
MGQMTLAFTRLLLREVSDNTLKNHRLLVVYAKQSFRGRQIHLGVFVVL